MINLISPTLIIFPFCWQDQPCKLLLAGQGHQHDDLRNHCFGSAAFFPGNSQNISHHAALKIKFLSVL